MIILKGKYFVEKANVPKINNLNFYKKKQYNFEEK